MKNNKRIILSKITIINIVFVTLALSVLIIYLSWLAWEKKQNEIHISIDTAITGIRDAGFEIEGVKYVKDYRAGGYLGFIENGVFVHIIYDAQKYSVLITQEVNWEHARNIAENNNRISSPQDWVFGYAFYYGDLAFHIQPSNKKLGNELHQAMKEIDVP